MKITKNMKSKIENLIKKALRNQQQGLQMDLFYHVNSGKFSAGFSTPGAWQPEENVKGKRINASFYTVRYIEPGPSGLGEGEPMESYVDIIEAAGFSLEKLYSEYRAETGEAEEEGDWLHDRHPELYEEIEKREWEEDIVPEIAHSLLSEAVDGLKDYLQRYFS